MNKIGSSQIFWKHHGHVEGLTKVANHIIRSCDSNYFDFIAKQEILIFKCVSGFKQYLLSAQLTISDFFCHILPKKFKFKNKRQNILAYIFIDF